MAENEGVGVRSNAETKENGPESPPIGNGVYLICGTLNNAIIF